MRGLYFDGTRVSVRTDVSAPRPSEGWVKLRVRCAGVCDTDLQIMRGYMGFRGVLGHEFVGEDESGRYVAEINNSCRLPSCRECSAGRFRHCPARSVLGILGASGAIADEVVVPQANLHRVPESVPDAMAVFVEPLAAALHILQDVDIGEGTRVAVFGDGKLGILSALSLATASREVTLIGKHAHKLNLVSGKLATIELDALPDHAQFDVVVDATGAAEGLSVAIAHVRPRGTIVLKTTVALSHTLALSPIVIHELCVVGSRCGDFAPALRALERREIDPTPLIESVFALDRADLALAAAAKPGARKVLVEVVPGALAPHRPNEFPDAVGA